MQYFDNNDSLVSKVREINFDFKGKKFIFLTDNGIFSKNHIDEGSRLLLEGVCLLSPCGNILDLGCGYGVVGLTLASLYPTLTCTLVDINVRALELSKNNAEALNVCSRVCIKESDVYSNISDKYDLIVSNPPIRAGKKVTYSIYSGAKEHLTNGGSLVIVIRKKQGADSAQKYLESLFLNVIVLKKHKGYVVLQAKNPRTDI